MRSFPKWTPRMRLVRSCRVSWGAYESYETLHKDRYWFPGNIQTWTHSPGMFRDQTFTLTTVTVPISWPFWAPPWGEGAVSSRPSAHGTGLGRWCRSRCGDTGRRESWYGPIFWLNFASITSWTLGWTFVENSEFTIYHLAFFQPQQCFLFFGTGSK